MSKTPIHGTPTVGPTSGENEVVSSSPPVTDRERIYGLELGHAEIRSRLREGAKTMGDIRSTLEHITTTWNEELDKRETKMEAALKKLEPPPRTLLQVMGVLVGPLLFLFGVVWVAARYPERSEFERLRETAVENRATLLRLTDRIHRLEERKTP